MNKIKGNMAICLNDLDDELSWSINKSLRFLATKLGYETKINKDLEVERLWWWYWWKVVWKLVCKLKSKNFLWLALANKILTWENGQKRRWVGPQHMHHF